MVIDPASSSGGRRQRRAGRSKTKLAGESPLPKRSSAPVPGGVGRMTIAMPAQNTLRAALLNTGGKSF
ncbi:MAG TPA: hypothetical protein VIH87_03695 [Methylocella sp.]